MMKAVSPANYRIEPDATVQQVSLEGRHGKTAVLAVEDRLLWRPATS